MYNILQFFILVLCVSLHAQDAVMQKADSLMALGNYSKAIELYKTHENPTTVNQKIASAYEAIGNYNQAAQYYQFAINNQPENTLLNYQYGKLLSKIKKYPEAKTVFSDLVNKDPKNPNFLFELGLLYEKTNDTLTLPTFQEVFKLDNNHQKAIFKIARNHLVKRRHDSVSFYVDNGLKTYPENLELISLKAQNYYWLQQYENAINWFEKLIDLGESSQQIHEMLSFAFKENYDYDLAIKQLEIALKYDPKNADNLFRVGQYYHKLSDNENAEKYMNAALLLMDQPLDKEYRELAVVYNFQKKYAEAIQVLNKSIKENPDNEYTHFILAYTKETYYADLQSKIEVYNKYLEKFPNGQFKPMVERRMADLKKEQFLEEN
ncbi:tetratricopeptide repeat protein [Paucihalobacter ruber]|uniref:Tetratricopeptide repeat protein n=2 Tax=Paucihalobacter ruber TaxID=2567861 RepID=A0A506PHG2_9FLAO|nr:tetratricopeptide repeat protein [Paucihalobacter ruber]